MSAPFVAEVRVFGFNFAPKGWALCNGQSLAIAQNQALFALLGTTYGGDGRTTFNLPNLQGGVPISFGPANPLGQLGGGATETLTVPEMASHTHVMQGVVSPASSTPSPAGNLPGNSASVAQYASGPPTALAPAAVGLNNGNQPHNNMQPYLVLNFCIALQGIFPSRN